MAQAVERRWFCGGQRRGLLGRTPIRALVIGIIWINSRAIELQNNSKPSLRKVGRITGRRLGLAPTHLSAAARASAPRERRSSGLIEVRVLISRYDRLTHTRRAGRRRRVGLK
jgi:hypothetical protein